MGKYDECPLTGLSGIFDEVYRAMVFQPNPMNIEPWVNVSDICDEVFKQRRICFIHTKQEDEHPGYI